MNTIIEPVIFGTLQRIALPKHNISMVDYINSTDAQTWPEIIIQTYRALQLNPTEIFYVGDIRLKELTVKQFAVLAPRSILTNKNFELVTLAHAVNSGYFHHLNELLAKIDRCEYLKNRLLH